ncbi:hypothetical protein KO506_12295 [Polaribacter vadi]|uniref:hypothetical protein n=1 Tax=Polaribacter TaxID=52959 RepID=UPI001C09FD53|nr:MULTISPECIES: hypothetical protein [Polaribacter]MBU3012188.1 hypothetical protein [Polaribacter vadi]MDO6742004.1 hypothetical protein [Polaribacter sp. 1_MG-2023]
MKKQINIKLILLETFSLLFIINGIQRLYIASQGKIYDAVINENWKKFESLTSESLGQFFANRAIWTIGIILIGILTIGIINWRKKIHTINSIILFLVIIGITLTGFFLTGITNQYLNYFCGIFAKNYGLSFFIGGTILTTIGITILWKTISLNKNTIHNTV